MRQEHIDFARSRFSHVSEIGEGLDFAGAALVAPVAGGSYQVHDTRCPAGVSEDDPDDTKFPTVLAGAYGSARLAITKAIDIADGVISSP